MTLLEAYTITKPFYTNYEKEKPFLSSEISLIKTKINGMTRHYFWVRNSEGKTVEKLISKKKYDSYNIKEEVNSIMLIKKIEENMFITSVGLVSEEEFYKAEDIMENTKYLKRREVEIDSLYLDVKGRELIYIGTLIVKPEHATKSEYKFQLFDIEMERFIDFASVKLVEFSSIYKENIYVNIGRFESESKRLR